TVERSGGARHPCQTEQRAPCSAAGIARRERRARRLSVQSDPVAEEGAMLDLIVTGGIAVMPTGAQPADTGVAGGRTAAVAAPGSLQSAGAARTVDAGGQIVIPGGVDPHIHCSSPI